MFVLTKLAVKGSFHNAINGINPISFAHITCITIENVSNNFFTNAKLFVSKPSLYVSQKDASNHEKKKKKEPRKKYKEQFLQRDECSCFLLSFFFPFFFFFFSPPECRSLRCARTTLHMNLFASFAVNNALWLVWYRCIVANTDLLLNNGVRT